MIIGFDAKRAFHNSRGLGNYSRDYLRLSATYAPDNDYVLFNPQREKSLSIPLEDRFSVVYPRGLWRLSHSGWRTWGCTQDIHKAGVEVFHGLSGELPMNIDTLKIKKVVTVHDAIFIRYPELYSASYRDFFTRKVKYACEVADVIVSISEQTKRDCIEYFGASEHKVQVMYQGCSNRFRDVVSEEEQMRVRAQYSLPKTYLLQVGAIEPRKNLHNMLLALSVSGLDIPLVVVGGDSAYASDMKKLAQEKNLRVYFCHNIPFKDFPAVYQSSFALLYPSVFEGFGLPILEGMCSGVPVLTSTGSCFSETGGEAALYANPSDVDDMSEKLRMIVTDNELRSDMIRLGHLQAEKFTDDKIGRNIKNLYEGLCK